MEQIFIFAVGYVCDLLLQLILGMNECLKIVWFLRINLIWIYILFRKICYQPDNVFIPPIRGSSTIGQVNSFAVKCDYFLSISLNMCFGYSQEQSRRDGSFEPPQHMSWSRNKKTNLKLRTLIWGPGVRVIQFMFLFPHHNISYVVSTQKNYLNNSALLSSKSYV